MRNLFFVAAALAIATPASAQTAVPANNAEMAAIFEADQAIRQRFMKEGFSQELAKEMFSGDIARRARTKGLLDSGALRTGDDYRSAAFVFQHGDKPEDFLLAHTLAVVAAARGRSDATWIAAATLDRYLQEIGQKQIYGTQYTTPEGGATTLEPYDRTLISDALRQAMRVPTQAEQEKRLQGMAARRKAQTAVTK